MDPILEITDDERRSGGIDAEKLSRSGALLDEYGYLIVKNVVSADSLEKLKTRMDAQWADFQRSSDKWMGGGRLIGHLQMVPPSAPDYFMKDVLVNDIIFQITSRLLGPDIVNVQYAGNTNLPGSVNQHFHADTGPDGINSLVVNVPLGSADEKNGSLAVIPKTHRETYTFREIETLQNEGRGLRVNSHIGDAVIRYPTLLHRGTHNPSVSPRHMLSMWHAPMGSVVETKTAAYSLDPGCRDMVGEDARRLKCRFEDNQKRPFNPNYFTPNLRGLIKELMFVHAPGLFSFVKRFKG